MEWVGDRWPDPGWPCQGHLLRGPGGLPSRDGALAASGGPLSRIGTKALAQADPSENFFLLLLVMSQGTGWKCIYEADETVAFSDICWTGVFQRSSRPRKGSASESVPTGRDEKFCFLGFPLTACQVGKLDLCHCVSYLDDVFQTIAKNHTYRVSQQIVATQ